MRREHCRRVAGALEQCSRDHKTSVTLFAAQLSAMRAVLPIGHNLEGGAFTTEDGDADKLEAHGLQPRLDDRSKPGFQCGGWLVFVQETDAQNKKGGP